MQYESGHSIDGALVSLGGMKGLPYRGRLVDQTLKACTIAPLVILSPNGNRISALIQNSPASPDWVGLHFGDDAFASNYIYLYPGQSFQIDSDLPWTGAVQAICQTSTATLSVTEISVP
jgi:hypothetical protein